MTAAKIDSAVFREAMARLGAAVSVVTTMGVEGDVGITVSSVCSVTDDPATLLVCINRSGRYYEAFHQAGVLCVNILAQEQEAISRLFAGQGELPMPARFAQAQWHRLATGAAALEGVTANLDCKISKSVDIGTHTVFFCAVQAVQLGATGSGLVYHGRQYHPLIGRAEPQSAAK